MSERLFVVKRILRYLVPCAPAIVKPDQVNVAEPAVTPFAIVVEANSLLSNEPLPLKSTQPYKLAVEPVEFKILFTVTL